MAKPVYTKAEVAKHKTYDKDAKDVWVIYKGLVLNVSKFAEDHPGGDDLIVEHAGKDITEQFEDIGHSAYASELIAGLVVGTLAKE